MADQRVAVVPRNRGEVLVRRRDGPDGDSQWTLLTGPSDGDHAAAARSSLHAETGIPEGAAELVRVGDPIRPADGDAPAADAPDGDGPLVPVLLDVDGREAAGEQCRWEWVAPPSLRSQGVAPWLWQAYGAVRPTVATVADDTDHGSTTLSVRALAVLRDEATLAAETDDPDRVRAVARDLIAARPSMTAVENRVNRAVAAAEETADAGGVAAAAVDTAHEGIERAARADGAAAANAADRIDGARVATLSRSGTVLAALDAADPAALLVAESRPGGEGVGVAERFATEADVTLSADAAFPSELDRWGADALLVGADTVLPDGSVRNKAGTYPGAAVAAREGVAVFVITATDKISHEPAVDREPWPGDPLYGGDAPVAAANPTFDVTPPACIDAIVTERGALAPDDVAAIAAKHRELAAWDDPA